MCGFTSSTATGFCELSAGGIPSSCVATSRSPCVPGFDVFLDTHDIRPGDPFQDVLWHRLVDSDVMVMLDTPTYFDSRWTRQEIGRARAQEIQVLRVIWPEHTPNKLTDLAETIYLDPKELEGPDGPIVAQPADTIVLEVERRSEERRVGKEGVSTCRSRG